ncbi:MAG TPA: hypothetical protein DCF61_06595, partial [Alphaproteobacteria bacterium]|nr:hypothetical protein [Alphaproteobacteria bacterium]
MRVAHSVQAEWRAQPVALLSQLVAAAVEWRARAVPLRLAQMAALLVAPVVVAQQPAFWLQAAQSVPVELTAAAQQALCLLHDLLRAREPQHAASYRLLA